MAQVTITHIDRGLPLGLPYLFSISAKTNEKIMKSFEPQPWVAPQPVLIIGTYNEDGKKLK